MPDLPPPGPELDALVAEKVMNSELTTTGGLDEFISDKTLPESLYDSGGRVTFEIVSEFVEDWP